MVKGVGIAAASIAVGLLLTACGAKPTREAFTAYVVNEGPGTVTPFSTLTVYVTNGDSWAVTPVNTATNQAGPPIKAGPQPDAIALTPDGTIAYIVNWQGP